MVEYGKIRDEIAETKSFGITIEEMEDFGNIGFSAGIRYLLREEPEARAEIKEALERFYNADFGTMYEGEWVEVPTHWEDRQAFGEYAIKSLDEPIYIHYEPHGMQYDVVVYLRFER